MPLQRPGAIVEMRKIIDTAPDLGALSRDEVAQLGGNPFAIAGGAQEGQLPIARQLQRARRACAVIERGLPAGSRPPESYGH